MWLFKLILFGLIAFLQSNIFADVDCSKQFQISSLDIDSIKHSTEFKKFSEPLGLGVISESVWLKITCSSKQKYIVEIGYGNLDYVDVYVEGLKTFNLGDQGGVQNRYLNKHLPNFLFDAAQYEEVYIRISTSGTMIVPVSIDDYKTFYEQSLYEYLWWGLFLGIMVSMLFYNFFLFISLHNRVFIFYVCYVLSSLLCQLNLSGMSASFFWPNHDWWVNQSFLIFVNSFWLFTSAFTREFLDLKRTSPKLDRLFIILIAACIVMYPITIMADYKTVIKIVQIFIIVISILKLLVGIKVARGGSLPARYFVLSWSIFLIANVTTSLRDMGVLAPNFYTDHGIKIGSALEVVLLSLGIGHMFRSIEKEKDQFKKQAQELSIVAQTVQMLAHDLRKPFSMISGLINVLSTKPSNAVQELIPELVPKIQDSVNDVNKMIDDVVVVDSSSIEKSDISLYFLIEKSLQDVLGRNEATNISFSFDLQHKAKLLVDQSKAVRIFENILENAVQAMGNDGKIWINSRSIKNFVEVTIGNSNSYIAQNDQKELFNIFFTKGKQGGTGLGLAIVEKFVKLHGGRIICRSDQIRGTEFIFTLPLSSCDESPIHLPLYSNEYRLTLRGKVSEELTNLVLAVKSYNKSINILVVDDEPFYQIIMKEQIPSDLSSLINMDSADNYHKAISKLGKEKYDLVIIDVDLGKTSESGFELLTAIKSQDMIKVVHTNRGAFSYQEKAYELGAKIFLPKPMTKEHFLKVIIATIEESVKKIGKTILIVDDEPEHLSLWKVLLAERGATTLFYSSLEDFFDTVERNSGFLASIDEILIDRFMGNTDTLKIGVPKYLKSQGFEGRVALFSNSVADSSTLPEGFDYIISKDINGIHKIFS